MAQLAYQIEKKEFDEDNIDKTELERIEDAERRAKKGMPSI